MTSYASTGLAPRSHSFGSIKGRSSQKEYWVTVAMIVAATVAIAVFFPKTEVFNIVATVAWVRTYSRRLHDCGMSGWWQCALYGGQVFLVLAGLIWAWPDLMAASRTQAHGNSALLQLWPIGVAVLATLLAQVGYTIWLGLRAGDAGPNRFGASPRAGDVAAAFD
jgi:uncharacterized membrane protein YhaH (DUF805 family)